MIQHQGFLLTTNANDKIFKNTRDNAFHLLPQVQQQLNETVFKKLKQNQFLKQHPKKIFEISLNKLFQKRKIFLLMMMNLMNIKSLKQYVLNNQALMTNDNEKAEISKLLLKTDIKIKDNFKWKKQKNRKPYRKLRKKENLRDALDVALADIQTVNYNDNTSLDDLETVNYNNDTSVIDLVPIRKLKTIKEDEKKFHFILENV